jgi:hypothetical protein
VLPTGMASRFVDIDREKARARIEARADARYASELAEHETKVAERRTRGRPR